jgi:hypothetical protein
MWQALNIRILTKLKVMQVNIGQKRIRLHFGHFFTNSSGHPDVDSRVARFFLTQYTKTGKNKPNLH